MSRVRSVEPLLEAHGLVKRYGGVSALVGVDFTVLQGEILGVVGPNGSGKTTLFDCLTRRQSLDAGRIVFDGTDITRARTHQVARMGMSRTFQDVRVYRNLTVVENMALSRDWSGEHVWDWLRPGTAGTIERARNLLEFLALGTHADALAGSLSWGQQRLLEIGMALMPNPSLLLLDEATSGVNPALVEVIRDRIRALNHTEGTTFVVIEHDIDLIIDTCDRVVVLDQGKRLAEGGVESVFEDPAVIEAYLGLAGEVLP